MSVTPHNGIYTITGLIDITPHNSLLKPEVVFEDEEVDWDHFNHWLYEQKLLGISQPIIESLLAELPADMDCACLSNSLHFVGEDASATLQFRVFADSDLSEPEFNLFLKETLADRINDEFGPVYKVFEELRHNHLPDEFCRHTPVRYRTESFSGLQERDAAEVMAYETFEMGNTDVLECLSGTILKGRPICETVRGFLRELEENGYVDDMGWGDKVNFFRQALNEVEEVTGVKVNYALWLADKDTVVDYYGRYMADKNDIDAYAVGPIVLSELGYDGTLYGYTEMPEPLEEHEIDILLAQESVQKPQKASFDDLVSDAQIRASEGSKAPQGIDFEPEH